MALNLKKILGAEEDDAFSTDQRENAFYKIRPEDVDNSDGGGKMILLEPRAYSEAQQIADYLKDRNTVVVNLKRANGTW